MQEALYAMQYNKQSEYSEIKSQKRNGGGVSNQIIR